MAITASSGDSGYGVSWPASSQGLDGWAQVGGTSLSSPLTASVYALAGNTGSVTYGS